MASIAQQRREKEEQIARLERALADPVYSLSYDGRGSRTYRSVADIERGLDRLKDELSKLNGTGPVRAAIAFPDRGY